MKIYEVGVVSMMAVLDLLMVNLPRFDCQMLDRS
jgi:hypothetical protein